GVFYILGAYVGYTTQRVTGNWPLAILFGTLAVGLTAFVVDQAISRVEGDLPRTLLTLGIATIIGDFCLSVWGGMPITLEAPGELRHPVTFGTFIYPGFRMFILVTALLIALGLWWLMHRTQLGRIIRAGVDNREMVAALGINIDLIFTVTFIVGG